MSAAGINRERRHALLREHAERLRKMSDDDVDHELRRLVRECSVDPPVADDADWLVWLAAVAAHRANRAEAKSTTGTS